MNRICQYLFWCIIGWSSTAFTQNPFYINYTIEDGLPSSQFYDSYQDDQGYFWFTSDRGMVRYDGYSFKTYTTDDGLASIVNFDIYKENAQVFWVNGYNKTLSYWDGYGFKPFRFNAKLKSLTSGNKWFRITNITDNEIYFIEDNPVYREQAFFKINRFDGAVDTVSRNDKKIIGESISERSRYRVENPLIRSSDLVIGFSTDHSGNRWMLTRQGAIKMVDNGADDRAVKYFDEIPISSVFQTAEGKYWYTSLDRGLFYVPAIDVNTINVKPSIHKPLKRMMAFDEFLFAVSVEDTISFFYQNDDSYFFSNPASHQKIQNKIREFYPKEQQEYQYDYNIIKGYLVYSNGYFLSTGALNDIFTLRGDSRQTIYSIKEKVNTGVEDDNQVLWLGTNTGIQKIDLKKKPLESITDASLSAVKDFRITKIQADKTGMWVSTLSNGLYFATRSLQKISHKNLEHKSIETLFKANDSTLWVGTNRGLIKIHYDLVDSLPAIRSLINYSKEEGLSGNKISHIQKLKDKLYVSTNNGVNYFIPRALKKSKLKPIIHIDEVLVNGNQRYQETLKTGLSHRQNNLKINYTGICSSKPTEPEFFYRYKLNANAWSYTNNRSVEFHLLPPADYTFLLQCQNSSGVWSDASILDFSIKPHFSQLLVFQLSLVLTVIFIALLILRSRVKASRVRQKNKILLKEVELATLRNQMNPHFVFNSLNTLQDYIFKGHVEEANAYIGEFSGLMRKSLEFSGKSAISLEEEVHFIKRYLSLEKRRFEDRFTFNVKTLFNADASGKKITPLMVQPLVENAVKHAFKELNAGESGRIEVTYMVHIDKVVVEIKDNGTGFQPRLSSPLHKPMGLSIVRQRLNLLNQKLNSTVASLTFNRVSEGTSISLTLPII